MSNTNQFQQLRKGSTVLLILSVIQDDPKYGYQIMREMEHRSDGYFNMAASLLYPALHRMEKNGLVKSEWLEEAGKHRRKYYTITQAGQKALLQYASEWRTFFDKLSVTIKPLYPLAEEKQ